MNRINIEIKAKCQNQDKIRKILKSLKADFKGTDHQIDTYFKIKSGRLKLREGNIENCLIFYKRKNISGPKQSEVILYEAELMTPLKKILTEILGQLVIIDKKREIFFIKNVKFHLDSVKNLGTFVEIEAIDDKGVMSKNKLLKQCDHYLKLFNIKKSDLISKSYSDLLLK
jgi:predicted adenylyl cyclase CyaB